MTTLFPAITWETEHPINLNYVFSSFFITTLIQFSLHISITCHSSIFDYIS